MADVYIIYSRTDIDFVAQLAAELSQHWDVWWDYELVGDFQQVIEAEMQVAQFVVVLWSESSRESAAVRDEVRLAVEGGKKIVGIRLNGTAPAYPYGQYSCVDMVTQSDSCLQPGFLQLKAKISTIVRPTKPPIRSLSLADSGIALPAVFLSVSSHETQLGPIDAIRALRVFNAKTILVSAYDFEKSRRKPELVDELIEFQSQGGFVLLDSGNYEKSRVQDETWTCEAFHEVLQHVPHNAAFCFDVMVSSSNVEEATHAIAEAVSCDARYTDKPVYPVVHAARDANNQYSQESLGPIVRRVSEALRPALIAIPEREMGDGLFSRIRCMLSIRARLAEMSFYQPIHLLGTGNPWSVVPLAAAGADSFDGLEWCRMVVDRADHRLNHFHHFDFFSYQAEVAESQITVAATRDPDLDYGGKVAFHNLDYYAEFTRELQSAAQRNNLLTFLADVLPKPVTQQIRREISELCP